MISWPKFRGTYLKINLLKTRLPTTKVRQYSGFTLVEVLVAIMITAVIGVMASQAFHAASTSASATDDALKRLSRVDRAWVVFERDFRYVVQKQITQEFGGPLPAFYVDATGEYLMTLLRSNVENPLGLPRTEMVRVGYRLVEDTLWRDTWYDVRLTDQSEARPQKVLEGIENLQIRALPIRANSLASSWITRWPDQGATGNDVPRAVEITLETEDYGEVIRVFEPLPGIKKAGSP